MKVGPELIESTAIFEPQGAAVCGEKNLSRASSVERFGMRASPDKTRKAESSSEPSDPQLVSLMDQVKAYVLEHPESSTKVLSQLSSFCSSIKRIK